MSSSEECYDKNESSAKVLEQSLDDVQGQVFKMGYHVSELFLQCAFRHYVFDAYQCKDVAEPIVDPNFGKCFMLSGEDRKQVISAQGWLIVLNMNTYQYPTDKCFTPETSGAILSVGKPFNPFDNQMLFLHPGRLSRIDMRAQHLTFMNLDDQKCLSNGDYKFSILNVTYSQTSCQQDCYLKSVLETCQCLPIIDKKFIKNDIWNSINYCTVHQLKNCVALNVSTSEVTNDVMNNCTNDCYIACDVWRYPIRVTDVPLAQVNFPLPVDDMVMALLSFSNLEVEVFEQQPFKTVDDMIADIGGQINLWVGASMMTLIQLPILFVTLCGWSFYKVVKR